MAPRSCSVATPNASILSQDPGIPATPSPDSAPPCGGPPIPTVSKSSDPAIPATPSSGVAKPCCGPEPTYVTFMGTSLAEDMASSNRTYTVPLPAWYAALNTAGLVVSYTDTALLWDASIRSPAASATAPRGISRDSTRACANRSRAVWFTVSATSFRCAAALSDRYTVPVPSVRLILEPFTAPTFPLNSMCTEPLPVWYVAFRNAILAVPYTVTFLAPVAALGCPLAPVTAPSPTRTIKDVAPAIRFLSASDSVANAAAPDEVALAVTYVALAPCAMLIFEPLAPTTSLSNCTDKVPLPAWYAAPLNMGLGTATALWFSAAVTAVTFPGAPAARMPGDASTYKADGCASHSLAGCPTYATASLPAHAPSGSGQSGFTTGTAAERTPSTSVTFLPPAGANSVPL